MTDPIGSAGWTFVIEGEIFFFVFVLVGFIMVTLAQLLWSLCCGKIPGWMRRLWS